MMRLPLCLVAALGLGAVTVTGAAGDTPSAEFDRVCTTHAEGAQPEDVALPDPRTDVVAGRVSLAFARVAARRLSRRKPP